MKRPRRDPEPQFSHPVRQITMMLVVLALCGAGAYLAFPRVSGVFLANVWLNGFIAFVFVIGVFACFWQVFQLSSSVNWLEGFAAERPGHEITIAPRLLAPLAALLRGRGARSHISASSARSILDSVGTRIEEERDITRYIINLLIFLGLLGTFFGLAMTVPAVVETIRSLAPTEEEGSLAVFDQLMTGLEAQLAGMGTAFSSSLLGLTGSLVVGLLELFAGHGQNRFYRQLEEWLSSITRLGHVAGDGDSPADTNLVVGVLEQTAEQIDALQEVVSASEHNRQRMEEQLAGLTHAVTLLVERMGAAPADQSAEALARLAEGQERLIAALEARPAAGDDAGLDAETRMRLRSIDVQLLRIFEEMAAGREETITDLRGDIAHLTNAVRQLARGTGTVTGRGG
ncbi:biopolymer transporter ExbB [Alkalilacustris brevis]|uniref:biopolymer transporter ExbB n=1 Tax=Alkalilacustris brevis TaxID=2026338 RepID=UPI000E0D908D|nr:biopolymer transporter ExbB [Alkalilacustris brevis]